MPNKASNAPGFGNGNGTLKQPTFPAPNRPEIFLPSIQTSSKASPLPGPKKRSYKRTIIKK